MYGFIVSPYSHSAWFAECLILINKMVLSSAVVFLNPGTATQHVVALCSYEDGSPILLFEADRDKTNNAADDQAAGPT